MQTRTEQHIEPGCDVIGSSGEKVGTVAYIVVKPPEMHVTDYVVSTGFLGRDVVVPVEEVERVEGGKVYLRIDKDEIKLHKDYVEVRYEQPPQEWAPPAGFFYPSQSVLWPTGGYYPEPSSVKINAPEGTVGLHEGMTVESSDGHKVGSIKGLEEDPSAGDVTELIIKEGFLFSHEARIPAKLVKEVHADRVTLSVPRDEVPGHAK